MSDIQNVARELSGSAATKSERITTGEIIRDAGPSQFADTFCFGLRFFACRGRGLAPFGRGPTALLA
jgi:hypothetical protein